MDDDDRTFRADFTGDGVKRLRSEVNEKLKEFMGDYTDDTLVEYVIVLLKNGRSKAEARNELNVFLGDDSDSFVSWLWDHLGSSLHLYVESCNTRVDEIPRINSILEDQIVTKDPLQLNSDSDKLKSGKTHRSRRNREWRSLVRDEEAPVPLRSAVTDNIHLDEKTHEKVSREIRSTSEKVARHKRNRPEELPQAKRGVDSQENTGPARRLLQFAFKEALATSKSPNSTSEPALKRLRSVVSTSAAESSVERARPRLQSLACVPNPMSTAIRAVEEAAKDVAKTSSSRNVFDRLGHANDHLIELSKPVIDDVDYRRHPREYHGDMGILESDTCMDSNSASDNEGYDQVRFTGGKEGDDESLMVQYSVAKNSDENKVKTKKEQDQSATVVGTSSKILNISVNVNTWKPSHPLEQGEIQQVGTRSIGRSNPKPLNEKTTVVSVANGNIKPATGTQKEPPKIPSVTQGLYATTGRPMEDVDSRTIFVSNVHFAATKDSLSRHFNKFGEVLKVIILTDAATGQPKGSAYVEFMRKEAAENALSLDGTSFMSRILKVVKKSSAHQDSTPMLTWPRSTRGSPFPPTTRFSRGFIPRGSYQTRPPIIKAGARSLQWKRENTSNPTQDSNNNNNVTNSHSLGVRSLTYVRNDQNTNGQSANAT